jgi:hypothetical protein
MTKARQACAALSLVVFGSVASGCFTVADDADDDDDQSSGDSCRSDEDCRSTQFCNSDDECERKATRPEPECDDDRDCRSGELCSSAGECLTECTTFCEFFARCSSMPPADCASSCNTVLEAPAPCGTAFGVYIQCVADEDSACAAAAQGCEDERELFAISCEALDG